MENLRCKGGIFWIVGGVGKNDESIPRNRLGCFKLVINGSVSVDSDE